MKKLFPLFLLPFLLFACNNGNSGTAVDNSDYVSFQVESFDDMPNCSKNREGNLAEVQGERKAYRCLDGIWEFDHDVYDSVFTEDDLPLCTSKKEGYSLFVQTEHSAYTCDGTRWVDTDDYFGDSEDRANRYEPPKQSSSSTNGSLISNSSSSVKVTELAEGSFTDSRDGRIYKTVVIGSQVWMAQNLNYETKNSYCYRDSAKYCNKYGRLYTWAAAMDSAGTWSVNGKGCGISSACSPTLPVRGACPKGWHLPDTTEWNALFAAVGGSSVAGTKLKSQSYGNGTDTFGFAALPAGNYYYGNSYDCSAGTNAYFWSSTEKDIEGAYIMRLYYDSDYARLSDTKGPNGFSVRCLKDSN